MLILVAWYLQVIDSAEAEGVRAARRCKGSVLLPSADQAQHAQQAQLVALGNGVVDVPEDPAVEQTAVDFAAQVHLILFWNCQISKWQLKFVVQLTACCASCEPSTVGW